MALPLDVLTLGPFEFIDFSPPDIMPGGGDQRVALHEILGGSRVVDVLGSSPHDRAWRGIFFSAEALPNALLLDQLRIAGQPLPLAWGAESRTVVITKFDYAVKRFNYVHYSICCMIADNLEASAPSTASTDSLVSDDVSSALNSSAANVSANNAIAVPQNSLGFGVGPV